MNRILSENQNAACSNSVFNIDCQINFLLLLNLTLYWTQILIFSWQYTILERRHRFPKMLFLSGEISRDVKVQVLWDPCCNILSLINPHLLIFLLPQTETVALTSVRKYDFLITQSVFPTEQTVSSFFYSEQQIQWIIVHLHHHWQVWSRTTVIITSTKCNSLHCGIRK